MKYRYKCLECEWAYSVDLPMGKNVPQTISKSHPGCDFRIMRKVIEVPMLNGVNRFGTRSAKDRRRA
jgi:hypothetical protein